MSCGCARKGDGGDGDILLDVCLLLPLQQATQPCSHTRTHTHTHTCTEGRSPTHTRIGTAYRALEERGELLDGCSHCCAVLCSVNHSQSKRVFVWAMSAENEDARVQDASSTALQQHTTDPTEHAVSAPAVACEEKKKEEEEDGGRVARTVPCDGCDRPSKYRCPACSFRSCRCSSTLITLEICIPVRLTPTLNRGGFAANSNTVFPSLSCSVACQRAHKDENNCSGKRPRTIMAESKEDLTETVVYNGISRPNMSNNRNRA
jgi:hypothetical protein